MNLHNSIELLDHRGVNGICTKIAISGSHITRPRIYTAIWVQIFTYSFIDILIIKWLVSVQNDPKISTKYKDLLWKVDNSRGVSKNYHKTNVFHNYWYFDYQVAHIRSPWQISVILSLEVFCWSCFNTCVSLFYLSSISLFYLYVLIGSLGSQSLA